MSVYDLTDDDVCELKNKEHINPITKRKDNHKYSEHELRELMGVNRDTYKRCKGRIRRK